MYLNINSVHWLIYLIYGRKLKDITYVAVWSEIRERTQFLRKMFGDDRMNEVGL